MSAFMLPGPEAAVLALVRAAIEGGLLVLAVAVVTRLFPRLPAATRTALWWLASLRLVAGLVALPVLALQLPAIPEVPRGLTRATLTAVGHLSPAGVALAPMAELARPSGNAARERGLAWRDGARFVRPLVRTTMPYALALWACGVLAALAFHVRSARRLQQTWRAAVPCENAGVRDWLTNRLGAHASARVQVRTSPDAGSPVLLAGFRPRILVPVSCLTLDPSRLRLVMAHELAHIRRHDLTLGTIPALAHALFWFHPLAHWAVEEYAQAREEACDADAVRACNESPHHYGELLLAYGIDRDRQLHTAASYGSRHASQLHRRLLMLAHGIRPTASQRLLGLGVLIIMGLIALIPVRLVAASRAEKAERATVSAGGSGSSSSAESEGGTPTSGGSNRSRTHTNRQTTSSSSDGGSYGYSYSTYGADGQSFSYGYGKSAKGGTGSNLTLNGSFDTRDTRWIESVSKTSPDGFGWFRLDGKNYAVREAAAVEQIRELMEPQSELGSRQGELGERQGELGSKQGELGGRQGELGGKQGELSGLIARLEAELASTRPGQARRSELRRRIADVESRVNALEVEQDELEAQQELLSKQQDQLGAQQDELGRQQEALSVRTRAEMHKLAQEFIRTGQAVRVDRH